MGLQVQVGTSGNDCVITIPAVANTLYVIQRVTYSYSGGISLGNSNLVIKFGSTSVFDVDVASSQGTFLYSMQSNPNQAVTVTLKGVALQIAKLSIYYDTYS